MADKILTARRERCAPPIGRLDGGTMLAPGKPLTFVTGVTD